MVDGNKMLNMQRQLRQNAHEFESFMKDLDSWQDDIKQQDLSLKNMKGKEKIAAPVRSAAVVKEVRSKVKSQKVKKQRIKSSDYKAWDKLNVDKMLEQISDEEQEVEKELAQSEEIEREVMKNKTSLEMKEEGNFHFKNGRYDTAIRCYTQAIAHDPVNAVLPANRAMAYLKLKKYTETEADCTLSVSLDPTYTKAYLRRGVARRAMGKVESAKKDFNDALKLDPENKQAIKEIKQIEEEEKPKNKVEVDFIPPKPKRGFVNPIFIPKNKRSKKPLVRIPVQEINLTSNKDSSQTPGDEKNSGDLISVINEKNIPDNSKKVMSEVVVMDYEQVTNLSPVLEVPPPPQTSFQFHSDVKKLKSNFNKLCEYLLQIPPGKISKILKQQIDSVLLVLIINSLKTLDGRSKLIIEYLENISQVKRFDFTVMFLSEQEKKNVLEIFEKLEISEECNEEKIRNLKNKYIL